MKRATIHSSFGSKVLMYSLNYNLHEHETRPMEVSILMKFMNLIVQQISKCITVQSF